MNKIVASLGMAALGASSIQSVSAQDISSAPPPKPWSVSASLRGFYDDNVNGTPKGASGKTDSFGFQFSPAAGFAWTDDQNTVNLGYRYDLNYYGNSIPNTSEPGKSGDHTDQTHTFFGSASHAFTERYKLSLSDSFVIGQQPDQLRLVSGPLNNYQRLSGNNIRNYGSIAFDAQLTPVFGLRLEYDNAYFDYAADAHNAPIPTFSGLLDRIQHTGLIEFNWLVQPETTALIGYNYGVVDYTGDEPIGFVIRPPFTFVPVMSDSRNSRSHYGYVGVNHVFLPDLTGSLKAGIQYIDFYNIHNTGTSPYVQAILNYTYAPESQLRFGFTQSRNPIYDAQARDADTSVVFGEIHHRIVPNLFGNLSGTFQNSTFNGGPHDGDSDQLYQIGLNLEYRINPYLSTEIGYNYDKLNSKVYGDFDRNRVYIGLTASY